MKSNLQLAISISLSIFLSGSLFAQSEWEDYIQEDRGDTVVIKPTSTTGYLNTMFHAIMGDTTATGERTNPNRVYETIPGEVYIYDGRANFDASVPELRIVAPAISADIVPPLHIKTTAPDGSFKKTFINVAGDLYMENQYLLMALTNNTLDREFMRAGGENSHFHYDNCIMEFTNWTFFYPRALHQTYKFTNCLMINIGAEGNLEKGTVFDSWMGTDTIWFENNTILNHGTLTHAWYHVAPSFSYFNHNTIVNSTQNPFLYTSQPEMVVTNNLFINTGLVPDYPGFYEGALAEDDKLPRSLISVDTLEDSWVTDYWPDGYTVASDADRKVLVDNNNAWWDARFTTMLNDNLPAIPDSLNAEWTSQMITMNSRTQAMFDDDEAYPYLNEGTWYSQEPDFANYADKVPEWIDFIITNSTPGDPNGGSAMPYWRTNEHMLTTPDWPPLADMSYTQSDLIDGALNGYPLGDLNWFPGLKSRWETSSESDTLIARLKSGTIPEAWAGVGIREQMSGFTSSIEVFPNPVSDIATVRFDIAISSDVEMTLFNILGEKVRMKKLGYYSAGVHEVSLSKGDLTPGIYILQLNTDDNYAGMIEKISIK
ncbi:MAG: T9SS type A sorting domain-containing protein [Bacteroidota bacterium]